MRAAVKSVVLALLAMAGCGGEIPRTGATSSELHASPDSPSLFGWNKSWDLVTKVHEPNHTPILLSWGSNRFDLFQMFETFDQKNAILQRTGDDQGHWAPDNGQWWTVPTRSQVRSDPAGIARDGKLVSLFFRGNGDNLLHVYWNGSQWLEENLGGTMIGRPAASYSYWRTDVFARAPGGRLFHRGLILDAQAGPWGGWEDVGLTLPSDPVAVSMRTSRIDVFFRDDDGQTRYFTWNVRPGSAASIDPMLGKSNWTGPFSIGGFARSLPSAVSAADGNLDVFVRGGEDGIWQQHFSEGQTPEWTGWQRVNDDCLQGDPAATARKGDLLRVDLVVKRKSDSALLHNRQWWSPTDTAGEPAVCCGRELEVCCGTSCENPADACFVNSLSSSCQPAGKLGQSCRPGGWCDDPGVECSPFGACAECGGRDEYCCTTTAGCNGDPALSCQNISGVNLCEPCGQYGQACCEGSRCSDPNARQCMPDNTCGPPKSPPTTTPPKLPPPACTYAPQPTVNFSVLAPIPANEPFTVEFKVDNQTCGSAATTATAFVRDSANRSQSSNPFSFTIRPWPNEEPIYWNITGLSAGTYDLCLTLSGFKTFCAQSGMCVGCGP
jgi:hypothetical protein